MNKKTLILIIVSVVIILANIFGIIDYNRIKNGEMPIFMIAQHDKSGPEISYYGLGYKLVRNPGISYKEKIYMDNYVKFGYWFYTKKIDINKPQINYINKFEIEFTKKCDNKVKLYHSLIDKNIYTYCIDNIKVINNNNTIELKEFLNIDNNHIEDIINQYTQEKEIYKDGGTKLYEGKNFKILKCKTLNDNNDIYIGNSSLKYENDYCKQTIKEFTKTYQVLNIANSNDEEYLYLTLRQFQVDEVETVKVNKSFGKISKDKYYEFTFKQPNTKIEDNIKSIFNNLDIVSIKETKKEGLEQIQDSIYNN